VQLRDAVRRVGDRLSNKPLFTGEATHETQQLLEVFVCREASRRKVPRFCHLSQLIERRAHVDVVQLAVVVPNDGEDVLGALSSAYGRVDEPGVAPATASADAPASPATAPPSSPPAIVAAAAVGVVVVANALLAGPIIPPVASGDNAHKLSTPVAHQPALT